MVTRPALPECPAVVPGGAQGFISGDCGGAVRFPGATVLADRNDRGGLAVDDGSVTAAGIQGKTTVAEASRSFDLSPSEIEGWVEDAKRGMENSLRANPLDIREQYEKQLKDLQEAYGEAMLELRARKKLAALMEREDGN
jgi:transposase-like protein